MVKHHPNGLQHRSVGDYAKMKFDKVKQAVGDKVQGAKKFVSGKVRDVRKSMQPKNVSLMGVRSRNFGAGLTANADKGMASALTHANKYGGDPVQHITSRIARRKLQANLRAKMMAGALLRNKFAIGGVAAAGGVYALHKRRKNRNPDLAASQTLSLGLRSTIAAHVNHLSQGLNVAHKFDGAGSNVHKISFIKGYAKGNIGKAKKFLNQPIGKIAAAAGKAIKGRHVLAGAGVIGAGYLATKGVKAIHQRLSKVQPLIGKKPTALSLGFFKRAYRRTAGAAGAATAIGGGLLAAKMHKNVGFGAAKLASFAGKTGSTAHILREGAKMTIGRSQIGRAIGVAGAIGGGLVARHQFKKLRAERPTALSLAKSLFGGRQPNDPITHILKIRGGDIVGNIPAGVRRHGRLAKRVGLNKQMVQNTFGAGNKLRKPVQHALRVIAKTKPQLAALAGLAVGAGVVASRMTHGKKKATSLSLARSFNGPLTHTGNINRLFTKSYNAPGSFGRGVQATERAGRLSKQATLSAKAATVGKLRKPLQHAARLIGRNPGTLAALGATSLGAGIIANRLGSRKKATSLSLSREVKFVEYANNCLVLDASSRKVD